MKQEKLNYFIFSLIVIILIVIFMSKTVLIKYSSSITTTIPYYPEILSIKDIKENQNLYKDKLVRIRGYGVASATIMLCPGFIGFDKRSVFFGAQENSIFALVKGSSSDIIYRDYLRTFEGYVRIFDGQIGCPGEIKTETFPYFEIIGVV